MIGVLAGGMLTDLLSWHWIFLVNMPIGVAVYILSLRLLPAAHGPAATGRVDYAGAITVTASLMLAVYAIVNGNEDGWTSAETLGLLGAALAVPRRLPRDRGACLLPARAARPVPQPQRLDVERRRVLMAAGMFAYFFFSALYLQLVLEYTPLEVGLAYLPGTVVWGARRSCSPSGS